MLKVKELSVNVAGKDIIRDINLEIAKGKINTIIGMNGCGKSTIIKCMTGQLSYDGLISYKDIDIKKIKKNYLKDISLLSQGAEYPRYITVKEYLWIAYHHQDHRHQTRVEYEKSMIRIMHMCEVEHLVDQEMYSLSGGQRQRVLLAFCLVKHPKVLILDEPTTFLDQASQVYILSLIKKINKLTGLTVVMVLHDVEQALNFSDYICVMSKGNLVIETPISKIDNFNFLDKYLEIKATVKKNKEWFYLTYNYEEIK